MEWNIIKHKVGNNQMEIKVSILVKELNNIWATDAESWARFFYDKLKEIPKTNIFSAEHAYKTTLRNPYSLEVWKMKTNGDFNYKMFTVTRKDKQ